MAAIDSSALVDLVLRHLGVLASGQNASNSDKDLVTSAALEAHTELSAARPRNLVPWELTAIPDGSQFAFRDYVAEKVLSDFDVSPSRLQTVLRAFNTSKRRLSRMLPDLHADGPSPADYF